MSQRVPPASPVTSAGTKRRRRRATGTQEEATVEQLDLGPDEKPKARPPTKRTATTMLPVQKVPQPRVGTTGRALSAEVEAAVADFVANVQRAGVDGLRKEFVDLKQYVAPDFRYEAFTANPQRNRYKDVVCLDASRVVLTLNVPPESDYVHANYVKLEGVERTFVAAQGPIEKTIPDFWRMAHQLEAGSVIMLCKTMEDGKPKCVQYFPLEAGAHKHSMFVTTKRVDQEDKFVTYTLEVLPEGCSNATFLKLIHVTDWPDRGVPSSGMSVLRLIRSIPTGACIVHCSAGVGRTGTVLAIEAAMQRLFKMGANVNIREIVKEIRNQRASAVQTEAQFVFIHGAILDYIRAKMPAKYREMVQQFHEDVKKAGMV
ncbi:Protein-tyrosine phosphatase [Aphelenchoides fujianensis]|nr:Protein-tyrosine phosphatase [Aphelenchoides fujianensis]KAI6226107.1 Protein-tyrosine phosphatase [Aphelenchoides fujianensis]KAI6226126.1 Protein-tyrosine phosphatase [Aphelenchoides fujianensis]